MSVSCPPIIINTNCVEIRTVGTECICVTHHGQDGNCTVHGFARAPTVEHASSGPSLDPHLSAQDTRTFPYEWWGD